MDFRNQHSRNQIFTDEELFAEIKKQGLLLLANGQQCTYRNLRPLIRCNSLRLSRFIRILKENKELPDHGRKVSYKIRESEKRKIKSVTIRLINDKPTNKE